MYVIQRKFVFVLEYPFLYVFVFLCQAALSALAAHSFDPSERDRLKFLASPLGKVCIINVNCQWVILGLPLRLENNKPLYNIDRMNINDISQRVKGAFWKLCLSLNQPNLHSVFSLLPFLLAFKLVIILFLPLQGKKTSLFLLSKVFKI